MNVHMRTIVVIFILMSLCRCHPNQNEFDDRFCDEISRYADTVGYRALIVFPAEKLNHNPENIIDGYVIGPCISSIIQNQKYLVLNSRKGKHIYIYTDLSSILKNTVYPLNYDNVKIDSVVSYIGYENKAVYTKEQIVCYLKKSKMLYKKNEKWNWNKQPDTLLLPKIIISQ